MPRVHLPFRFDDGGGKVWSMGNSCQSPTLSSNFPVQKPIVPELWGREVGSEMHVGYRGQIRSRPNEKGEGRDEGLRTTAKNGGSPTLTPLVQPNAGK